MADKVQFFNSRHRELQKLMNSRALQPEERYELEQLERQQQSAFQQASEGLKGLQELNAAGIDIGDLVEKLRTSALFRIAIQMLLNWSTKGDQTGLQSAGASQGFNAEPTKECNHKESALQTMQLAAQTYAAACNHYCSCCVQEGEDLSLKSSADPTRVEQENSDDPVQQVRKRADSAKQAQTRRDMEDARARTAAAPEPHTEEVVTEPKPVNVLDPANKSETPRPTVNPNRGPTGTSKTK